MKLRIDREAIRFYSDRGQINCHYWTLNPFIVPSAWWGRVRTFAESLWRGITGRVL